MVRIARPPFLTSLSIHAVVIVVLIGLRSTRETPRASDTEPRTDARLVYLSDPRPSGGGPTGGGEKQPAPTRRAQARGTDAVSTPVAPPRTFTPQPVVPDFDLDAPVIAAVPAFADVDLIRGLPDPQLPVVGTQGPGDAGVGNARRGNGRRGPGDDGPGFNPGPPGPGNGVSAPVPVRQVRPQYTSGAMSARVAGSVIVECIVMPDGSVGEARVTRSLDARFGLDEEALKAARQWRFRPGTLNGRPIAVRVTIELTFSIY